MKNHPEASEKILRFFRWFCHPDFQEEFEGDLQERFHQQLEIGSVRNAQWQLLRDVVSLFRPSLIRPFYPVNHLIMLRQNFKISWRTLWKNKGFSLINITGLALGMSIAILIGLWLQEELQFDRQFEHRDRVAQVMQHRTFDGTIQTWNTTMYPLADEMRNTYGHLFKAVAKATYPQQYIFKIGEESFYKAGIFAEPVITDMLSLEMRSGTAGSIEEPTAILLSETFASTLFGAANPIGQTLTIADSLVTVGGVFADFAVNSSYFDVHYFGSWLLHKRLDDWISTMETPWRPNSFQTLVHLADNTTIEAASASIKTVIADNTAHIAPVAASNPVTFLHPMSKWHLNSRFENGINMGGRIDDVLLFGIVGAFILLLACINFMNLSTARSEKRAKEVGVRKVLGSFRSQLMAQFYSESILVAALAFLVALLFSVLALPSFNVVADKTITIPWAQADWWLLCAAGILFIGFLAGSYPALYLSSFKIGTALQANVGQTNRVLTPRRILVVSQFTIAISLIIGVLIVNQQVQFGKDRPTGYNQDQLVTLPVRSGRIYEHFETIEEQIAQIDQVLSVASASCPVTKTCSTTSSMTWRGRDAEAGVDFAATSVSDNYGSTIDWQIKQGRDFSADLASDSSAILLNEAAAGIMGFSDPVGEVVEVYGSQYHVIGVVNDLIVNSPFQETKPQFYALNGGFGGMLHLKFKAGEGTDKTLAQLETIFKTHDPDLAFDYAFVDEAYARTMQSEVRTGNLVSVFTLLAIIISCLGLFGLAAYIAERRRKEIGIRKVLGASILNLWQLLSKEFMLLVALACGIAVPIAFYFSSNWLEKFAYRTELSWTVFVLAAGLALLITLLTVSFQTIRAAMANPVEAIQAE